MGTKKWTAEERREHGRRMKASWRAKKKRHAAKKRETLPAVRKSNGLNEVPESFEVPIVELNSALPPDIETLAQLIVAVWRAAR